MNPEKNDDVIDLLSGLRHAEKEKRAECVRNLVHTGDRAVPGLIALLGDPEWTVRYRAAETLGLIGSVVAVPALITGCADPKDHVRNMAAKGLGLIRDPAAVSPLVMLLADEHPYTRAVAAEGLAGIGGRESREAILSALRHEHDPCVRERMEQSLEKKG